ncbi:Fe-S cluster assembly protein SufD [Vagococcus fluvialis]|jgi:Fe-S cluster assembly protein SufD|uniref:Fe-S cluster assembly protein SufD n=1 Tax=Vagococcus fluvialis TaxID=2738 RepID=UPI000A33C072|nr:Fe-S cluster assembly protein SufD [Vagococcus fluvialis]MDR2277063.1 Fe-S cluster assembly protein SufD [Vagococcus sp.]OTP34381.1 FeS assembly protein SufD [Enterococcus sp. 6C8_DIV0013]MBO0419885.1 Fe-S cluster assembly protein SufD [Vagococcus fluvialis]MBO0437534.1 Fe-S cluster assembly protein SufD [Vagococcus fluvialis]UDM79281.1 Fe-S cluster assembly protein SufD [Vagococcus fluvialis]
MKNANLKDYLDDITLFSASQEEPQWMLDLRLKALEKCEELDLPKIERVKIHRWPLMNVGNLNEEILGNPVLPSFDEMEDNPMIIQGRTTTLYEQMPVELSEQGVIFTDIFTAMKEHSELVEEYFMTKAVPMDEDKMTAFHTAFLNGGVFLYVPKNVVVKEAFESLFFQSMTDNSAWIKHVLIVAEENSEVTYLERLHTEGEGSEKISANFVVEVIAKPGSKVKFAAIDRLGENVSTYMNRRAHVMRDASVDWALGIMNDGDVIADFDSDLAGVGSHSEVKVVAISSGRQVQGIDTRVTNMAPHSVGNILQHGVIRERGTLTFNGIGHILKGAKGADAQQESRVLMLSDKARGDANPILLIDEFEVTAGHAASAGRLDPEELYYLMSRGIPQKEAERLVTRGFLGSVITAIPVKAVQDEFVEVIDRKLVD